MNVKKLTLIALLAIFALGLAAAPAEAGGVRIRPSIGIHWGPGWGYPYGWYGPSRYYGYGYGPGWGYTVVYPNDSHRYGALDTDISPERAEVWVDGKMVGLADDFDGFPEYLLLEKGTYDVAFYLPGYKTIARQYSIYPGLVIDVEDRMEKGESIHPSDLASKSTERRDERLRRDRELQDEVAARERAPSPVWQQRGAEAEESALDARGEPGRVRLRIEPDDASVYLDGRFLGTGRELARLRAGLMVDPGEHLLQVVRPGREEQARRFELEPGREIELEIRLSED